MLPTYEFMPSLETLMLQNKISLYGSTDVARAVLASLPPSHSSGCFLLTAMDQQGFRLTLSPEYPEK